MNVLSRTLLEIPDVRHSLVYSLLGLVSFQQVFFYLRKLESISLRQLQEVGLIVGAHSFRNHATEGFFEVVFGCYADLVNIVQLMNKRRDFLSRLEEGYIFFDHIIHVSPVDTVDIFIASGNSSIRAWGRFISLAAGHFSIKHQENVFEDFVFGRLVFIPIEKFFSGGIKGFLQGVN